MSTNPFRELDATKRTVKRAQYEALEFTLAPDGIQVRNESHANPAAHEYLVEVVDGVPTSCTCPADERYDGACKHRVAVGIRRSIVDAAMRRQLVADGGTPVATPTGDRGELEDESQDDADCRCDNLPDDFPCWECYRCGRRDFPSDESIKSRSKRDFHQ